MMGGNTRTTGSNSPAFPPNASRWKGSTTQSSAQHCCKADMPTAPPRPCLHPGCRAYAHYRGRCDEHARKREQQRGNFRERGYSPAWTRLSKWFRTHNPLCEPCRLGTYGPKKLTPSACVDHRVSKARGGTDEHSNLIAMCWSCHSRKTYREDGSFGRARLVETERQACNG